MSFVAACPDHPYALAGLDALQGGIAALREVGQAAGLRYIGDLSANFCLPTALGAVAEAALVPESFAAGDLRQTGPMVIAGPAGWRDFYPRLCAENLARQGHAAQGVYFDLPEMASLSQFDVTPVGWPISLSGPTCVNALPRNLSRNWTARRASAYRPCSA